MTAAELQQRLDHFSAKCRELGLAVTPQRLAIYRALAGTEAHPSPDDLHTAVRRELPTVSLGTVYKTLDTLSSAGLVRRVESPAGVGRYDANLDSHHHVVCVRCHRVEDVYSPSLDGVRAPAGVKSRYQLLEHGVQFRGVCEACRTSSRRSRR